MVTKAVWSLWTKPLAFDWGFGWETEKHHLCAWILSFETARRHFATTSLVTDQGGADLLVNRLGLQFDEVSTDLDDLGDVNPEWWALGKLHAYARQETPFVHIDSDVFLWEPLPNELLQAKIFAQNPEIRGQDDPAYRVFDFVWAIRQAGGWLPKKLDWYHQHHSDQFLVPCCGLFGGTDLAPIRDYANLGINMMRASENLAAWPYLGDQLFVSLIFEQYLLSACLAHGKVSPGSIFCNTEIEYLFSSEADAFSKASSIGYTHLISGAKRHPQTLAHLEKRVRQDYPKYFERCVMHKI